MKGELTIAEAAALTRRSRRTIYRWIDERKVRVIETQDGPRVRASELLAVQARVRPGRPRRVAVDENVANPHNR